MFYLTENTNGQWKPWVVIKGNPIKQQLEIQITIQAVVEALFIFLVQMK